MHKSLQKGFIIGLATLAIAGSTFAQRPDVQAEGDELGSNRQAAQEARQEKLETVQARLAGKKLAACRKREAKVNAIMARIANRGEKQLAVFTKIAERTKTFYTNKGKTISNYDALVAEVGTKKAAAEAAIDAVTSTSVSFKCDGSDPKGAAASFKESLKSQIAALKAYKTAVKNLIVGVKSAQGTAASGKTSPEASEGGEQ